MKQHHKGALPSSRGLALKVADPRLDREIVAELLVWTYEEVVNSENRIWFHENIEGAS